MQFRKWLVITRKNSKLEKQKLRIQTSTRIGMMSEEPCLVAFAKKGNKKIPSIDENVENRRSYSLRSLASKGFPDGYSTGCVCVRFHQKLRTYEVVFANDA